MDSDERRSVAVLAFLHGLVHGNILSIPIFLSLAWRNEFRADDVTLGVLAAVAYASFGIGSIPFGYLADRKGAPPLLLACVSGIAVSVTAVCLSPTLLALGIALASLGLFSGIYHPTGLSYISRRIREQGQGMGWHGMGGSLGIASGPAVVGVLLGLGFPWRPVAAVLVVPSLVAIVLLIARPLEDSLVPTENPASLLAAARRALSPAFVLVLLVYMFAGITYWGSLTFLPRFVGPGSYAFLLGLGAIGQVLAGHLADRPMPGRTVFVLSCGGALLLVALAIGPSGLLLASAWAFGFVLFSLEPLQNTLVTSAVRPGQRGLAFGMTFLSVFGIGSVGAVLAGYLLSRDATELLFLLLAGFLAISGFCGWRAGLKTSAAMGRGQGHEPPERFRRR